MQSAANACIVACGSTAEALAAHGSINLGEVGTEQTAGGLNARQHTAQSAFVDLQLK